MRLGFIRLGDPTTSGGKVLTASGGPFFVIDGKPASLEGDLAECPAHGGTFKITGGYDGWIQQGKRAAVEDLSRLECGCGLIATIRNSFAAVKQSSRANSGKAATALSMSSAATPVDGGYDEQIRFLSDKGMPLGRTRYTLKAANGSTFDGVTDPNGNTARIVTREPIAIVEATFLPPERMQPCCARSAPIGARTVAVREVRTNADRVGYSIAKVTIEGEARRLTTREIAMARSVFGNAIDYSAVKIHNEEYLWFGLQDERTAITPDGEIYFSPSRFKEDFSIEPIVDRWWLIHEMVHVWQFQLGYPVKKEGLLIRPKSGFGLAYDPYGYSLTRLDGSNPRLSEFNMEQQGDLIADYFLVESRLVTHAHKAAMSHSGQRVDDWAKFYRVMLDFLANPRDRSLLPANRESTGPGRGG